MNDMAGWHGIDGSDGRSHGWMYGRIDGWTSFVKDDTLNQCSTDELKSEIDKWQKRMQDI